MKHHLSTILLLLSACAHTAGESPPTEVRGPAIAPPKIAEATFPADSLKPAPPLPSSPVLSPAEKAHAELMELRKNNSESARSSAMLHLHGKFAACEAVRVWNPYKIEVLARHNQFRVRLAGLDLLERELEGAGPNDPFYQQAQAWLRNTITDRRLHIVFDEKQLESDDQGEATAYVFYQPWGTDRWVFLNRQMIAEGMALYKPIRGWLYDMELRQAEMDARFARRGVWGEQIRRQIGELPKSAPPTDIPTINGVE